MFIAVVYRESAFWAAGDFFICSTTVGLWGKLATRLSDYTESSSLNTFVAWRLKDMAVYQVGRLYERNYPVAS